MRGVLTFHSELCVPWWKLRLCETCWEDWSAGSTPWLLVCPWAHLCLLTEPLPQPRDSHLRSPLHADLKWISLVRFQHCRQSPISDDFQVKSLKVVPTSNPVKSTYNLGVSYLSLRVEGITRQANGGGSAVPPPPVEQCSPKREFWVVSHQSPPLWSFLLGILRFYSFALFFKSVSTENVESLSWEEIKSPYYFLKTILFAYVRLFVQACALVLVGMHAWMLRYIWRPEDNLSCVLGSWELFFQMVSVIE